MTPTPHSPDALDQVLSDYFKAQMPRPWPPAPAVAASPASRPVADPSRRARWTLAASVALLVGSCWFLADGPAPPGRTASPPSPATGADLLPATTATKPGVFKTTPRPKSATAEPSAAAKPGSINLP